LHNMMLHAGYHPIVPISLGLTILFLIAAMFPQQRLWILESAWIAALLISFFWLFFRRNLEGALLDWSLTLVLPIYLGWSMSFFLVLRGYEPAWPFSSGPWWLLPHGVWWLL